ncbi:hypothetical protein [Egbenema bharatensis]
MPNLRGAEFWWVDTGNDTLGDIRLAVSGEETSGDMAAQKQIAIDHGIT